MGSFLEEFFPDVYRRMKGDVRVKAFTHAPAGGAPTVDVASVTPGEGGRCPEGEPRQYCLRYRQYCTGRPAGIGPPHHSAR